MSDLLFKNAPQNLSLPLGVTVGGLGLTSFGSSGQILISQGSNAAFTYSGAPNIAVVSKSSAYSISGSDYLILCDASGAGFSVTLPTAAGVSGKIYYIKKSDSTFNAVTITTTSSQTIDGKTSTTLNTQNEAICVVSDGTNWQILERRIPCVSTHVTGAASLVSWASQTTEYWWERSGDSAIISVLTTGTGGSAGNYTFTLPNGWSIANYSSQTLVTQVGEGQLDHIGTVYGPLTAVYLSSTTIDLLYQSSLSTQAYVSATSPVSFASGDYVFFKMKIPISGWQG